MGSVRRSALIFILYSSYSPAGPEVIEQALRVLQLVKAKKSDIDLHISTHDFGGIAIDNHGEPLPESTLNACKSADAILMGAYIF